MPRHAGIAALASTFALHRQPSKFLGDSRPRAFINGSQSLLQQPYMSGFEPPASRRHWFSSVGLVEY